MIFTERQITVHKGKSSINEPVILYRGDYEVSIKFTIMESKFRFKSGVNLVDSEKASFGQLAILAPYGGNVFSETVKCEDGTVTFTLTKEMIDQLEEVGLYSFQIRLFDYYKESRVSIPPVEFGIEVREPVASEDHDNSVNNAIVGYSIAKIVDGLNEDVPDTFDANGNYNKTDWETGDRITEGKLNKIEDALDKINQNEKADVAALDKRVTNNFNILDVDKASKDSVNLIENRIDSIAKLKEGSTTGDAELIDGRIAANGYIHDNIGDSIRNQVRSTSQSLNDFTINKRRIFKPACGWQYRALSSTGDAGDPLNSKISMFDKYTPVNNNVIYHFSIIPDHQFRVFLWDADMQLIDSEVVWLNADRTMMFDDASYFRIELSRKDGNPLTEQNVAKIKSIPDQDILTIYEEDASEYSSEYNFELAGHYDAVSSNDGAFALYGTEKVITKMIPIVSDDMVLYNSFNPFVTDFNATIYEYDKYCSFIKYTVVSSVNERVFKSYDFIKLKNILSPDCEYIAIAFWGALAVDGGGTTSEAIESNIKLLYKQKNIKTEENKLVQRLISDDNMQQGLMSTQGVHVSEGYTHSLCTINPISVKAGNAIWLDDYSRSIMTIRVMDKDTVINSIEIKNGIYVFDNDCLIHVNVLAWDHENNTGLIKDSYFERIPMKGHNAKILRYMIPEQATSKTLTAIENARKICNMAWTPLKDIPRHGGYFSPDTVYYGPPYSSARVTDTMIGNNISFRSFLSCLKNPNGAIYTENLSKPPYNQPNANTFMGMVCSTFVGYCIGLPTRPTTVNWSTVEGMRRIKKDVDMIQPGDTLNYKDPVGTDGHVRLAGEVVRDADGKVVTVEILESWPPTTKRNVYSRNTMIDMLNNDHYEIYRYDKINSTVDIPLEFTFEAEEYLNIDYGNYSYYRVGRPVKVTRLKSVYSYLIVRNKSGAIIQSINITNEITELTNLTEGEYSVSLATNMNGADETPSIYFIVIDDFTEITQNGSNIRIKIGSNTGNPLWFAWNDNTHVVMKSREFTGDEKINGFADDTFKSGTWIIKVFYENDYGVFASEPITITIP